MKTGIKVCDAMTHEPVFMPLDSTIKQAAEKMAKMHLGAMLIGSKSNLQGIITEQDIVREVLLKSEDPLNAKVKDYMAKSIRTIEPEKDIYEALIKMRELKIRHLPVKDGDTMIGLLTLKDVLKIEPQLFDLMLERITLREETRKPIDKTRSKEGICQVCGNYSEELFEDDDVLYCENCKDLD